MKYIKLYESFEDKEFEKVIQDIFLDSGFNVELVDRKAQNGIAVNITSRNGPFLYIPQDYNNSFLLSTIIDQVKFCISYIEKYTSYKILCLRVNGINRLPVTDLDKLIRHINGKEREIYKFDLLFIES